MVTRAPGQIVTSPSKTFEEMPWQELEGARVEQDLKKTQDEIRADIYGVWRMIDSWRQIMSAAPTDKEVDRLQGRLLTLTKNVIGMWASVQHDGDRHAEFLALENQHSIDLEEHIETLMLAACRVERTLGQAGPSVMPRHTSKSLTASELRYFMGLAQSEWPGTDCMRGRIWGFNPRPESPPFQAFTCILLERNYETHDFKNAQAYLDQVALKRRKSTI